ncbi:MAG: site-2 protease family protein [Clostridia bacterium]|nr:site-2 protease family protein [Clostridia bacterium]
MLFNVLSSGGSLGEKLLFLFSYVIALLPAFTVHEWAHGYTAYKLGDGTAKADGRLSLNPFDHLDLVGSLMLLFVGFGWAKPVPVNTRYFKKPRRDFALTALAGPLANFILGAISVLLYVFTFYLCEANELSGVTSVAIENVFYYSAVCNFGLGIFNLLPLPPLDGSNIVICMLPHNLAAKYSKIRYYSGYIFLALILLQRVPMLDFIPNLFFWPVTAGRDLLIELFINIGNSIFFPIFFG